MYKQTTSSILPEGTVLKELYRIESHLASGGFGNTYLATVGKSKKKVAIKEFFIHEICVRRKSDWNVTAGTTTNYNLFIAQQKKFHTEAERIKKLNNKHIVKVRDLFCQNGTSYYVMEFIQGYNLAELLKFLDRPLDETETKHLVVQLLDALEYIHGESIFHLDLKPANMIVQKGSGTLKLIDFGSSKMMENGRASATTTGLNYSKGYAPIEQMEQSIEKVGAWTDLYALGATMYNLLTRQQPPMPSDISENGIDILPMPADVSEKTRQLVYWLMSPERKKRPQSVEEVKEYLNYKTSIEPEIEVAADETDYNEEITARNDETTLRSDETTARSDEKTLRSEEKASSCEEIIVSSKDETARSNIKHKRKVKVKYIKKRPGLIFNIIKAVFILLIGVSLFCIVYRIINYNKEAEPDETTVESESVKVEKKYVRDSVVHVKLGPDFMHEYTYTGEVSRNKGNLPQGYGTAVAHLKDGRTITYKGRFKNGLCEDDTDNATMKFSNGAKYEGTFVMGYYKKGTFTDCQGNVFVGEFFNKNQFKNGKRTLRDGTVEYYNNGELTDKKSRT